MSAARVCNAGRNLIEGQQVLLIAVRAQDSELARGKEHLGSIQQSQAGTCCQRPTAWHQPAVVRGARLLRHDSGRAARTAGRRHRHSARDVAQPPVEEPLDALESDLVQFRSAQRKQSRRDVELVRVSNERRAVCCEVGIKRDVHARVWSQRCCPCALLVHDLRRAERKCRTNRQVGHEIARASGGALPDRVDGRHDAAVSFAVHQLGVQLHRASGPFGLRSTCRCKRPLRCAADRLADHHQPTVRVLPRARAAEETNKRHLV